MTPEPQPLSPEQLLVHAQWVRRLALRLVADPNVADDVVQETWIAALERPPARPASDGSPVPARAWLARVLRNFVLQRSRGESRRAERESRRAVSADGPDPLGERELVEEVDGQRAVVQEVLDLPEPLRSTVLLRYFKDLSSAEIARRQGVPAATVRSRLSRGLEELRIRMDARYGGSRSAWCAVLAGVSGLDVPLPVAPATPAASATAAPWSLGADGILKGALVMKIGVVLTVAVGAVTLTVAGIASMGGDGGGVAARDPESAEAVPVPTASPARLDPPAPTERLAPVAEREEARVALAPAEAVREEPAPAEPEPGFAPTVVVARFTDAAGNAIAGVEWAAFRRRGGEWELQSATESDARGTARLEVAMTRESDEPMMRHVLAGYVPGATRALARSGEQVHVGTITLLPSVTIAGRVVDPDGDPVAGASVFVQGPELPDDPEGQLRRIGPGGLHASSGRDGLLAQTTAEDGRFEIPGAASSPTRVCAGAEGWRFAWTDVVESGPGRPIFDVEIVLERLEREDRIAGVALDADGDPIRGVYVSYTFDDVSLSVSSGVAVDSDGRFELVVVRRVPHTFTLNGDEHHPGTAVARSVEPGTLDVVLQLSEKGEIELVVEDERGDPVRSFELETRTLFGPGSSTSRSRIVASPEGRERLAVPADEFEFDVRADGFVSRTLGPYDVASYPPSILCVLEDAKGVRGEVLAGDDPIEGARVELYRLIEPGTRYEVNGFPSRVQFSAVDEAVTDEAGAFVLFPPTDGEYLVRAVPPEGPKGSGLAAAESAPFPVVPSLGVDDVVVRPEPGGSLVVHVVPAPGEDVAGVIVGVTDGGGDRRTARTDEGGSVRFGGLRPGRWIVRRSECELSAGGGTTMSSAFGGGVAPEIAWSCDVRSGETTEHELRLD